MWALERSGRAPQVMSDIDRTLIDSHLGAELALAAVADAVQLPVHIVRELRDQYIASQNPRGSIKFHPKKFISYVCEQLFQGIKEPEFTQKVQQLLRVYLDGQHYGRAVYQEVPAVLHDLEQCCLLGTFSEGVRVWQLYKLYCTRLLSFFPHTQLRQIFPDKRIPEVISNLPVGAIIPDDNIVVIGLLWAAKQAGQPIHPVWVNRISAGKPEWLTGPEILSFEELPEVVAQIQRQRN